jgi:hypothetical protein
VTSSNISSASPAENNQRCSSCLATWGKTESHLSNYQAHDWHKLLFKHREWGQHEVQHWRKMRYTIAQLQFDLLKAAKHWWLTATRKMHEIDSHILQDKKFRL